MPRIFFLSRSGENNQTVGFKAIDFKSHDNGTMAFLFLKRAMAHIGIKCTTAVPKQAKPWTITIQPYFIVQTQVKILATQKSYIYICIHMCIYMHICLYIYFPLYIFLHSVIQLKLWWIWGIEDTLQPPHSHWGRKEMALHAARPRARRRAVVKKRQLILGKALRSQHRKRCEGHSVNFLAGLLPDCFVSCLWNHPGCASEVEMFWTEMPLLCGCLFSCSATAITPGHSFTPSGGKTSWSGGEAKMICK